MGIWAAAAIGVASAAAGAAVSMNAADKAAAAQKSAEKSAAKRDAAAIAKQEEAAKQFEVDIADVKAPKWDIRVDIAEAERLTGYNINELERIYPKAKNQRQLASMAITDYMKGIVPQDVQEQTMRMIAERGGAGFNIATAGQGMGVQGPQADFARSLGLTSLQLQQTGMGMSGDWQRLATAFIESPLQVGQARFGVEQYATDIEMEKAKAKFSARAGATEMALRQSAAQLGRSTESIGSRLAAQQAVGSGIMSTGSALSGALAGYGRSQAAGAGTSGYTSGYGSMVSSTDYAAGQRGTGIAGSLQNAYYGQLGKPTYYDAGSNRSVVYGTNTIG